MACLCGLAGLVMVRATLDEQYPLGFNSWPDANTISGAYIMKLVSYVRKEGSP